MKSFEVKLYSKNWTFKKTINPKNITSEIAFSEDLDWGQSDLNIQIIWDFWDFLCSDILEIREVDEENYSISKTYTGIIEEIDVDEYETHDVVSLQVLWLFTALNDILFKQGWNRVFSVNMTPGNMVKAIIDSFNAEYWTLSWGNTQNITTNLFRYTAWSIDVTGTAINREFDNVSCLDALKKAVENTSFNFFIWSDGMVNVQQDSWQTKKSLTMWREVVKVNRKLHKREMVNKYYHERVSANEQIYTDPSSIALFNLKERKEVDSDVLDATSQNVIGNKKISDYAYERNEISVLMKPQKSESVFPGMLLSINNLKNAFVEKKITKITKWKDSWTIYVGDFISFWNSVLKK